MEKKKKSQIITFVGVAMFAAGVCVLGATLLSQYFGNSEPTSTNTNTTNEMTAPVPSNWKNDIVLNIPSDVVGGTKEVHLTEFVPYCDKAFSQSNVKYLKDRNDPYLFKITVANPDGENTRAYEEYLNSNSDYTYTCDDYFNNVVAKGYVYDYESYRLMVTPFFNNYVDNLYIRYLPNGENWPSSTLYNNFHNNAYSMIPGMNLVATPNVSSVIDSCLSFQYEAEESEILLYKQTLKYFGYEEINGIYVNGLNNTVMIDMSVENTISITAPTK